MALNDSGGPSALHVLQVLHWVLFFTFQWILHSVVVFCCSPSPLHCPHPHCLRFYTITSYDTDTAHCTWLSVYMYVCNCIYVTVSSCKYSLLFLFLSFVLLFCTLLCLNVSFWCHIFEDIFLHVLSVQWGGAITALHCTIQCYNDNKDESWTLIRSPESTKTERWLNWDEKMQFNFRRANVWEQGPSDRLLSQSHHLIIVSWCVTRTLLLELVDVEPLFTVL